LRPAARSKLGFFPCPSAAIDHILPRLLPPAKGTAILDPCAGAGAAIQQFARGLRLDDSSVWMVELHAERGEECRAAMPTATVLSPCSFLQTDIRHGSFGLVMANPPFDDSLTKGVRVEEQFLSRVAHLLCTGGVLVFVCPENITQRPGFIGIMSTYFQNIDVVPFPRIVRNHEEVFVLAQRIEGFRASKVSYRDLMARGGGSYSIPKAPGPGARFKKTGLTDDELIDYLGRSNLLSDFTAPKEFAMPSPPLALGKGHLALLLASGHLDGLVVDGSDSHVVRGVARKVEEITDEETERTSSSTVTKTIYTEKIKLSIRAVWPDGLIRNLE
jgi:hypothetical protein